MPLTLPRALPWAGMRCPVGTPGADPILPITVTPATTSRSRLRPFRAPVPYFTKDLGCRRIWLRPTDSWLKSRPHVRNRSPPSRRLKVWVRRATPTDRTVPLSPLLRVFESGRRPSRPRTGSSAAAVGTTTPSTAARRTTTGTRRATATTTSASASRALGHLPVWPRLRTRPARSRIIVQVDRPVPAPAGQNPMPHGVW